jgi:hypothetical protein
MALKCKNPINPITEISPIECPLISEYNDNSAIFLWGAPIALKEATSNHQYGQNSMASVAQNLADSVSDRTQDTRPSWAPVRSSTAWTFSVSTHCTLASFCSSCIHRSCILVGAERFGCDRSAAYIWISNCSTIPATSGALQTPNHSTKNAQLL